MESRQLRDDAALIEIHAECERRRVPGTDGDAGRLWVFTAAERALAEGDAPARLFAWLLNNNRRLYATDRYEDAAHARLKAHLHPRYWSEPAGEASGQAKPRELSPDGRRVAIVVAQARLKRADAYELMRRVCERKGEGAWTRERWDAAVAELPPRSQPSKDPTHA